MMPHFCMIMLSPQIIMIVIWSQSLKIQHGQIGLKSHHSHPSHRVYPQLSCYHRVVQLQTTSTVSIRVRHHHVASVPTYKRPLFLISIVQHISRDPSLSVSSHADLEYDPSLSFSKLHRQVFISLHLRGSPISITSNKRCQTIVSWTIWKLALTRLIWYWSQCVLILETWVVKLSITSSATNTSIGQNNNPRWVKDTLSLFKSIWVNTLHTFTSTTKLFTSRIRSQAQTSSLAQSISFNANKTNHVVAVKSKTISVSAISSLTPAILKNRTKSTG